MDVCFLPWGLWYSCTQLGDWKWYNWSIRIIHCRQLRIKIWQRHQPGIHLFASPKEERKWSSGGTQHEQPRTSAYMAGKATYASIKTFVETGRHSEFGKADHCTFHWMLSGQVGGGRVNSLENLADKQLLNTSLQAVRIAKQFRTPAGFGMPLKRWSFGRATLIQMNWQWSFSSTT